MLAIVCLSVCLCAVYLEFNGFEYIKVYCGQPAVMSVFFAFLAARHRAVLFSIFVLLIFIARWQINLMIMLLDDTLYCIPSTWNVLLQKSSCFQLLFLKQWYFTR